MEAKTYAKSHTTTNESLPYFCKSDIIGGRPPPLVPQMSATGLNSLAKVLTCTSPSRRQLVCSSRKQFSAKIPLCQFLFNISNH